MARLMEFHCQQSTTAALSAGKPRRAASPVKQAVETPVKDSGSPQVEHQHDE
jgi:hypothetical protein